MKDLAEALAILLKYGDRHMVHAEHDIIYLGSTAEWSAYTEEDLARLEELGVHKDTNTGIGFYHFT